MLENFTMRVVIILNCISFVYPQPANFCSAQKKILHSIFIMNQKSHEWSFTIETNADSRLYVVIFVTLAAGCNFISLMPWI